MSSRVLANPLNISDIVRWGHQYPGYCSPQVLRGPHAEATCALCGITPPDMKFCVPIPKEGVFYVADTPERDIKLIPQLVLCICEKCQGRIKNEIMCCDICRRPIDPDNLCSIMKLEPFSEEELSIVCYLCENSVLRDDPGTPNIPVYFLNPLDHSREDLDSITTYIMDGEGYIPIVPRNKKIEELFQSH